LYLDFVREDFRHPMVELYLRQMHEHVPVTYYEFPAVPPSGRAVWLGQHVQLVEHNGRPVGIIALARDITLRKRIERNQGYLSVRDRSTKLLNAGAFRALVEHRMALARRNSDGFHVLFMRVENMNDATATSGPAAAEEMAQHLAEALRATFRTSDILARLQPDEFAVVAIEAGTDAATLLNERLQQNIRAIGRTPLPLVSVSHAYYDPKFPASVEALFNTHSAIPA
jgi:diguanylate cyclase (GGDEF)-like protein